MTQKELKLMAGNTIKESEHSISAKKQLLNFVIDEANDSQLKALILDGKIVNGLEEDAIEIIDRRFYIILEKANQEGIEEVKEFIEAGKDCLCKIMELDCEDMSKFEGIINFIVNEASDYQVLSMLFEEYLPEETSNPEKELHLYEQLMEANKVFSRLHPKAAATAAVAGVGAAVGGFTAPAAVVAGTLVYGAYAAYRSAMKSLGKKCQTFKSEDEKQECLKNAKNKSIKTQISVLTKGMKRCKKSKDPVKCTDVIRKKINELQPQIK